MHTIDWILVIAPMLLVIAFAIYTNRFVKSVADFLSAGRCAGRYLLANARGESDSGLANTMSKFEVVLISGFVLNFWEKISTPALLLIGITGFVVYRFRETRAMTLAQFFEARYSRRFRLFMGLLAFVSGILNYGIFPAVSARFFIYFLRLPEHVSLGGFELSTMALIMAGYLICTVFMILVGGQVTLMVTDCLEGILSHAIYIVIAISVFTIVSWTQIVDVMSNAPRGKSLIDPFDAQEVEDFNIWYIVMALVMSVYTTMALQNKQGFNSAARNAHESRMGHVLGHWRTYARLLMILLLGACAVTFLRHSDFQYESQPIQQSINSIQDDYLKKQMTVPISLSYLLPIGVKGLFCAIMVMGLLAGDSGHMHSWGSILVQDVILPLRKKPLSPWQHIWFLRLAVIAVASFAFAFSLLFTQTQYILMWWALTAGVFTGGAGAAIIGGLYWKRGTTAGAWAGAITGSSMGLIGILLSNKTTWGWLTRGFGGEVDKSGRVIGEKIFNGIGPTFADWGIRLPAEFWLNGLQMSVLAAGAAVTVYVIVSLLTCRSAYNLDKLLHRGAYAIEGEDLAPQMSLWDRFRLKNILKLDNNFTFADSLVSGGIFWWAILLLTINIVISVLNMFVYDWPVKWWGYYWMVTAIAFPFLIAIATLIWFSIGGIKDMRDFFQALRTMQRDARDDGRVQAEGPVEAAGPITVTEPADAVKAAKAPAEAVR